jgi:DNA-binding NarL/FixJ family response regulator
VSAPPPIRVLLADDQSLVLAGLRTILSAEPDIEVVGQARDGAEAVRLAASLRPDVALLDIRMPALDGVSAAGQIIAADPGIRVVMLTTFDLDEYVYAALRAGASGFLVKDIPDEAMVAGVRAVHRGDTLLAPTVSRRLIEQYVRRPPGAVPAPGADTLTPREREVWQLVTAGYSNAEIAAALYLGEATVKTHVSRLLTKLAARDRIQLVVLGFQSGLGLPSPP